MVDGTASLKRNASASRLRMLPRLFTWVDSHPTVYLWLLAAAMGLLAVTLLMTWKQPTQAPAQTRHLTLALVLLLTLLAWRWPFLLHPSPLNPDEPAFIAGALTIERDPAFWRSLDTTTAGPLTAMALLPLHWLGVPQDYFNARLTGLLLAWGTLCLLASAIQRQWDRGTVMVALLPPALLYGCAVEGDLLHYSSEVVPVFLLALSGWLLAQGRGGSRAAWWASGLVAGLLPWAKLQAGPFSLVLGFAALALARGTPELRADWRRRWAEYLVAALIPTFALTALITVQGEWRNFVESYLLNNLRYVAASSLTAGFRNLVRLSLLTHQMPAYLFAPVLLVISATAAALVRRRLPASAWWLGAVATGTALIVILAPGRGFTHYLLFLPVPLAWWCAASLGELLAGTSTAKSRRAILAAATLLPLTLQLSARAEQPMPAPLGQLAMSWRMPRDEIGDVVQALRRPGDTLATWGWNSHLYVETGLPQATREAQTERQIRPSPQRDTYYRPRLLAELQREPPAFFIDAVGPGAFQFSDRQTEAHESFPALAAFVAAHYELVADYGGSRLFMLRARTRDARLIARALTTASHKQRPPPEPTVEMNVLPGRPARTLDRHHDVSMVEPPATVEWPLDGTERTFTLEYGYDPKAYENPAQGNGTEFSMVLAYPDGKSEVLFHRLLDPARIRGDRGPQIMLLSLPTCPDGSRLRLETKPGLHDDNAWDWAYAAKAGFGRGPWVSPRFNAAVV